MRKRVCPARVSPLMIMDAMRLVSAQTGKGNVTSLRRRLRRDAILTMDLAVVVLTLTAICASAQLSPPDSQIPLEFFGLHIHRGGGIPWPVAPFGTWRLWDASVVWPWLEPKRGEWHFQALDALGQFGDLGLGRGEAARSNGRITCGSCAEC